MEVVCPEHVTSYAKDFNDPLCLDALKCFLEGVAKLTSDMVLMHIPTGGIYLTASVL